MNNKSNSQIDWNQYSSVEWQVEKSQKDSILFYRLSSGGRDTFLERIQSSNFGLCLVTSDEGFDDERIISLTDTEWLFLREEALDHFYSIPNAVYLGVTGTNGKSTVTDLVRQICRINSIDIVTVGTLGVYYNDDVVADFKLTTPDYIDLRKTLSQYEAFVVCMEMSSHALEQNRFGSLRFNQIGWTNFTQDHLDYHKTMESYFAAKMRCFEYLKEDGKVIIPASQKEMFDKVADPRKASAASFNSGESGFLKIEYNKDNMGLAIELLKASGLNIVNFEPIKPVPGRFNIFEYGNSFVVVDFAHTPDALQSLGFEIKKSFPDFDIITLFGCGGDRDKKKRPLMAKAASSFSDWLILTSDNPRSEEPLAIIEDMIPGVSTGYETIPDRKQAIEKGMQSLKKEKKILLVAGKGHENYIEIKGKRHPFNDTEIVREVIDA